MCFRHRPLVFDHDHATGLFRGLLCAPCNTALGRYEKNRVEIQRYLDAALVPRTLDRAS